MLKSKSPYIKPSENLPSIKMEPPSSRLLHLYWLLHLYYCIILVIIHYGFFVCLKLCLFQSAGRRRVQLQILRYGYSNWIMQGYFEGVLREREKFWDHLISKYLGYLERRWWTRGWVRWLSHFSRQEHEPYQTVRHWERWCQIS